LIDDDENDLRFPHKIECMERGIDVEKWVIVEGCREVIAESARIFCRRETE